MACCFSARRHTQRLFGLRSRSHRFRESRAIAHPHHPLRKPTSLRKRWLRFLLRSHFPLKLRRTGSGLSRTSCSSLRNRTPNEARLPPSAYPPPSTRAQKYDRQSLYVGQRPLHLIHLRFSLHSSKNRELSAPVTSPAPSPHPPPPALSHSHWADPSPWPGAHLSGRVAAPLSSHPPGP